jgi:hypothetical protein
MKNYMFILRLQVALQMRSKEYALYIQIGKKESHKTMRVPLHLSQHSSSYFVISSPEDENNLQKFTCFILTIMSMGKSNKEPIELYKSALWYQTYVRGSAVHINQSAEPPLL